MTKKRRSSQAVSEVVDVILLLGITIGLFAFLNYVVFSYSFQPSAPSVNLVGSIDNGYITIEHNGGEPLDKSTIINIESNNAAYNNQKSISDLLTITSGWNFNNINGDNKWNFGETVQFGPVSIMNGEYIRAIVIDPSTNTLILSAILQQGSTTSGNANNHPAFGAPTPVNGSANNPLSLTWNIPISDLEGNTFTWTIQCNGQTSTAAGASNGTKTLALSGLAYSKTYTVWVNATDPTPAGSGLYTRRWYTFTTKANHPPTFGAPTPANNSVNQPAIISWHIPINDPEGNSFSWTIQCSNGQQTNGIGTNGTYSLSLSGLSNSVQFYKVWVNATDQSSGLTSSSWYRFTRKTNI